MGDPIRPKSHRQELYTDVPNVSHTRGTLRNGARVPRLHPGEMLREEFLIPLGMTPEVLAQRINVTKARVVAIVNEKAGLDGDMCFRLARFFRMTPEFWMNCEKYYELSSAARKWPKICKEIKMHPKDRKTGALKIPNGKAEARTN